MKRQLSLVIACALSASLGALVTSTSPVFADGNPATDTVPRYVPYKGTLEKDGVGYSGTVGMTFKLYDGTSTTAAWTESQTVTVYSGAFQVLLGSDSTASATSLTEVLKDADDVYLSVSLTTSSGTVDLSNKQRLMPTPYAIWTTSSTDFTVGDDLDVDGDAVIDATLTVGGAFKANTTAEIVSTSKFSGNASFESTTDSNGSSSAPVVIGSSSSQKLYVDGN
ncbi:MAG: hypothetical protein IV100_22250, partial [Myxococcales bacterium]|nr:hypothetical protein [Myxococcales bacterium]